MVGDDLVLLAALEIARRRLPVERVVLEIDHAGVVVGRGVVVVERGELGDRAAEVGLPDPPVEVDDLGLVLLDQFGVAGQPVARPCLADLGPVVHHAVIVAPGSNHWCAGP